MLERFTMKSPKVKYHLTKSESEALKKLSEFLKAEWPQAILKLFGSKVTGTADDESDIDLLIVLPAVINENIRKRIIHSVFRTNLEYGSNISTLIVSRDEWVNGHLSVLPIHETIESEGVVL